MISEKYKAGNWEGSKAGISDKVLPPWTPVEVNGKVVKVWGREYGFIDKPFPSQINILGEDILAGPITIEIKGKDKTIQFRENSVHTSKVSEEKAIFEFHADSDFIQLKGKTEIEYDGMIKTMLSLIPKGAKTINEFNITIPFKKHYASLFHFRLGQWGSARNSGKVPEKGFKLPFKPFIWLGNEKAGLFWFTETNENWHNKDKKNVLQVISQDEAVKLRIKVIDTEFTLDKEMKYVFGLQATPVKPFPDDWHKKHIAHVGYYGIEKQLWRGSGLISLKYPASENINLNQGTVDFWVSLKFNPDSEIDLPPHFPEMELCLRRIFRGIYARKLFTFWLDKERMIGLYWYVPKRTLRVYVKDGKKFPLIMDGEVKWKEEEWHHIALSYGRKLMLYVDNRLIASQDYQGILKADNLEEAVLEFGGNEGCDFVIDEIRTSDIQRESFNLASPSKVAKDTLLLDHLDNIYPVDNKWQTKPEKISVGNGGVLTGTDKLVNGKFGKGLMLCEDRPPKTTLEHIKDYGVNVLVFHEHWSDIQNYPDYNHEKEIKNLVKLCHRNDIKLLLYFGLEISNIAPEWENYYEECLSKLPGEPLELSWYRPPEQRTYKVCYNSKWQDFIAHGIKRVVEDFGIDGVYLDGTAVPQLCMNYLHGCGYKSSDGTYQPTYPIFAVRNLMKRIYNICVVKHHGMVSAHQSTCNVIPTLAFATSYWDGEQFGWSTGDTLDILPLEEFRAEFMGKNWGLPAEFLTYIPYAWTVDEALAFTLLHDVCIRPVNVGPMLKKISEIWKIEDEFDINNAKWCPYWENQDLIKVSPKDIKVSFYIHNKKKGILLIVSNLGRETTSAFLELNLPGLGIELLKVRDAMTKEEIPVDKSVLKLSLNKMSMRIIHLSDEKKDYA